MTTGKRLSTVLLVLLALLLFPAGMNAGELPIEGILQIQWGEPERQRGGIEVYEVTTSSRSVYQLSLTDTQKAQLGYQSGVHVTLQVSSMQGSQAVVQAVLAVDALPSVRFDGVESRVRRYLNILCASPGTDTFPYPSSRYQLLMQEESNFWNKTAGMTFSSVTTEMVFASKSISSYIILDSRSGRRVPMFHELSNDCARAAANQVGNPASYDGINFFFAEDIGCCAWGGSVTVTMNGVTKDYKATWMPPWEWMLAGLAHELGHSIGLPHSAGVDGAAYGNRFDLMSDLWFDCSRFTDPEWGCLPQGTIYSQLMRLNAIDPSRYKIVATESPDLQTVYLASLYTKPESVPLGYVFGVTINQAKYYGQYGLTVEYRDNRKGRDYPYDVRLPDRGVVIHERNLFGRPEPEHLQMPDANTLVWRTGAKLTYPFTTICVVKETQYGAQLHIGLNGVDCANLPQASAGGHVTFDQVKISTSGFFQSSLPQTVSVALMRKEEPVDKLMAVITLTQLVSQPTSYQGAWYHCDKPGVYYVIGFVNNVAIQHTPAHINCSNRFLPSIVR